MLFLTPTYIPATVVSWNAGMLARGYHYHSQAKRRQTCIGKLIFFKDYKWQQSTANSLHLIFYLSVSIVTSPSWVLLWSWLVLVCGEHPRESLQTRNLTLSLPCLTQANAIAHYLFPAFLFSLWRVLASLLCAIHTNHWGLNILSLGWAKPLLTASKHTCRTFFPNHKENTVPLT